VGPLVIRVPGAVFCKATSQESALAEFELAKAEGRVKTIV
jgi:hypothetical protein